MLKQLIDQFNTEMAFEQPFDANQDGSYSFQFDSNLDITLSEGTHGEILFYMKLAELPTRQREDFFLKTMTANLFGRETGGAAIGIDYEEKNFVLIDFLHEDRGYRAFYEKLESFANYAEAWCKETREYIEEHEVEE